MTPVPTSVSRTRRSLVSWALVGLLGFGFSSCTTIPAAEFAYFKETVAATRSVSENVILDYAAQKKRYESLPRQSDDENGNGATDPLILDIAAIARHVDKADDIDARLEAWNILARYLDALNALAMGQKAKEISASMDGLMGSLSSFPVAAVAEFAGDIQPGINAAKLIVEEIQKEQSRQKFMESLQKVAPTIKAFISKILIPDAQNYYNTRLAFYRRDHAPILDRLQDMIDAYQAEYDKATLKESLDDVGEDLEEEVDLLNLALKPLRGWKTPVSMTAKSGGMEEAEDFIERMNSKVMEMKPLIAAARGLTIEMEAYKETMIGYSLLIKRFQEAIDELLLAIEKEESKPFDPSALFQAVRTAKRAYSIYKESR